MKTIPHGYGSNLHVAGDPWLLSLLAQIGSPQTSTRHVTELIRSAYRGLCGWTLAQEFPTIQGRVETRMAATEPRGFFEGPLLCPTTCLVIVAVIRAGVLPAQTCYEMACQVLPAENVRLDFLNMARVTDEDGRVTGVNFDGSKIGGPIDDAVLLLPDPMGATGGTVARTLDVYKELGGAPRKTVALHMMVTPEAVQRLQSTHPTTRILAGRFDRGLSPTEVLQTPPGTHRDQERGLNDNHYIVPGAGGLGELLTNSWI